MYNPIQSFQPALELGKEVITFYFVIDNLRFAQII